MLALDDLHQELTAQGLLRDVSLEAFIALAEDAVSWDCEAGYGPFEAMAILEAYYGLEVLPTGSVDPVRIERCVRDRVLVFNELHEVPDEVVEAGFGALARVLGIELELDRARFDEADDFFDAELLTGLLEEALTGRDERPVMFGEDTWVGWIVRDTIAPSGLGLFAEPP